MGAGASSNSVANAYTTEDKAAIMKELDKSYTELTSTGGLSDIELYSHMTTKFRSLNTQHLVQELPVASEISDTLLADINAISEKDSSNIEEQKLIPDELAGTNVVAVEEIGNWEAGDEDGHYDTEFETESALLTHSTSADLLKDLVQEQNQQDKKISEYMAALKEGNVRTSKASGFRTRRLTYAQKTIEDPEPPSPEKRLRQRTTIYASSEIGVRQEKKAPFPDTMLGTFSCHGIEPARETDNVEDGEDNDDDAFSGPMPHDKINQDRGCVVHPFLQKLTEALFLVLDGHGEQGDKISEFVLRQLVVSLEKSPLLESSPSEALKDAFVMTNLALMTTTINYMTSGTTCVCCYLRGRTLYVANCGDSRAVMGVFVNGEVKARNLSRDHKPDDEEEAKRITEWGGFVRPAPEPGLSARVYLDENFTMIGLAMARSLGDFAVKSIGVIAEPEIMQFEVDQNDQFMIMASDGVWEFIGSQEAVDIIQEKFAAGANCRQACQELIEQASQRWAEEEGDYRDDITCIVVKFPLPFM